MNSASRNGHAGGRGWAEWIYRSRWWLSLVVVALVAVPFVIGAGRVARFSAAVASLEDTSNGTAAVKPLAFDPSMDVWFGDEDVSVRTYYEIEDTFVAEDFVMVTFEEKDSELGVFSRSALAATARLTERFLTVPGVRHVRSLTYNPWIRWGTIADEESSEEGLIISDLVEGDPTELTDRDLVERMIAVLGAERAIARVGEERVREVIGDADLSDFIGEPRLVGTIVNSAGTTTAIQVQVLRPRLDETVTEANFDDPDERRSAPILHSVEKQRAALRGIEHFLRVEKGLAVPTPERVHLVEWIESLPAGEERRARRLELDDPRRNFMRDGGGVLRRKFFEYDPSPKGGFVDRSEPSSVVSAPGDFRPEPLSPYAFRLGGVPLFERNFEIVGLADAKYVPLMFLVIIVVLAFVFRSVAGVGFPLIVVFGSIVGMIGFALARGDLLNNLTIMSPNMLTAVGIADAIHLIAAWVILRGKYDDKRELMIEVVRRNALPVFLTSVTTAVGFYSLTLSGLEPVRMLGSMAALGTLLAWALSMTVVPALLSLVPHSGARRKRGKRLLVTTLFSEACSGRIVDFIVERRRGVVAVAAALFVVSVAGLLRVEIDSDFRNMFPDDNPTMSDFNWIEDRMGGVGDLEIVFRGRGESAVELTADEESRLAELALREAGAAAQPNEFAALSSGEAAELSALRDKRAAWNAPRIGISPAFLDSLDRFEARLREEMADPASPLAVLSDLVGPLDILRKIHQVQNENRADAYRVPREADVAGESRAPQLNFDEWTEEWSLTPAQSGSSLVAQYYLQYENGARPGENLTTQLSADRTQVRVQGRVAQASSVAHLRAFRRIEEIARTEFPELAASVAEAGTSSASGPALSDFTISGKTLLFARTSDLFARGFVKSMGAALLVITVLIGFIYRSARFALISLIPNVLPIILPLGVLGLAGIPLDGPAVFAASVALGVCVDDTIHFFTKYDRGRKGGLGARDALVRVFTEAGTAMSVTTIVLIIGFATLLLSDFAPNFQMGALAGVMIGFAWIADFVITGAVLSFDDREAAPRARIDMPAEVGKAGVR